MGEKWFNRQGKRTKTIETGGVAIVTDKIRCKGAVQAGNKSVAGKNLWESKRYVRITVPLRFKGKRNKETKQTGKSRTIPVHILNLYNLAKNGEAARIIKERNHARVLDDTTLLDKNDPIIICMDTNSKDSRMLRRAINTGQWFDVAEIFSTSEPEATFCARKDWDKKEKGKGITRPDRVLINGAAKEMIRGYRLVKEAKFPGHIPIEIQFKNELEIAESFEMEKQKKQKAQKNG